MPNDTVSPGGPILIPGAPTDLTPEDTVLVHARTVPCDGGTGPSGHPRVWLRITGDATMCPYCSRHFVLDHSLPIDGDVHS